MILYERFYMRYERLGYTRAAHYARKIKKLIYTYTNSNFLGVLSMGI